MFPKLKKILYVFYGYFFNDIKCRSNIIKKNVCLYLTFICLFYILSAYLSAYNDVVKCYKSRILVKSLDSRQCNLI